MLSVPIYRFSDLARLRDSSTSDGTKGSRRQQYPAGLFTFRLRHIIRYYYCSRDDLNK